tara:strand:+ start:7550 stop:9073 length:1524 start_codon:yes stop_codon:yes gene_type:complete
MGLATDISQNCSESIQVALEQIEFFQDQVKILDNEKVPYDESIRRLDANLLEQTNVVNRAFNDVETAYKDRIAGICKTDLFWRVTNINGSVDPVEYDLECTKLTPGGYTQKSDFTYPSDLDDPNYFGNTVILLRPNASIEVFPINFQNERGLGVGYTFGFDPRNYYGLKYYDEPYSEDIGNTFVTSFIGTITQGSNNLTVMNPVGAGVSDVLEIGQIIVPELDSVFSGTTKITGISTGLTDLRDIDSLVGIGTSLSFVNILTLNNSALQSVKAPQTNGTYGSFEVIDDPDTVVNTGRYLYQINKEKDPFVPQTVGIMQTANLGIGVSIALDNSGYPTAAMGWDPNLNGWDVSMDPNREEIIYPPRVGSGVCYWPVGFSNFPRASSGSATKAIEGATITVDEDDIGDMYGSLSACSSALNTAVTDAVGIASTKETDLIGGNSIRNLKVDGLNALRGERNEKYSLRIWGMRVSIGQQNEDMDRLATLRTYLGDDTIRNVMDKSIPPTGA